MAENPFHIIMNPLSIATVGAGNNPMKMGTMNAISIIKDGFPGKIFPIHRRDDTVLGYRAFKSVSDLPEVPNLALLIVPADSIAAYLEEFGKIGTRRAIVITAGFKEIGDEGIREEKKINEIAARYDIRFVGPNCMGILNTELPLNTTVQVLRMKPGKLGFASQSGTYVTQVLPYLEKRGISFSKAISVGNEANIDIVDALEYLGEDEQTKAIALYIEGIRDVSRFLSVARKITPRKPVIAQYIGGSEAGARSGLSHTGAMAGPDYLYEGLFKQAGVIRVDSIEDLYGHGWILATQPRLRGNRIGVITNSGGPGSAMADTCNKAGYEMPLFSDELHKKLLPFLPPHAPSRNPVDMTFSTDMNMLISNIPETVMQSGEVDAVVLHGPMRTGFMRVKYEHLKTLLNDAPLEDLIELMGRESPDVFQLPHKYGIPMAVSSFYDREDDLTVAYHENEIPVYDSPEKTAWAMAALLKYRAITERKAYREPAIPEKSDEADTIIRNAVKKGQRSLDENSAKKFLACYGIPVTRDILVHTEESVEAAADELGYPLVIKICDQDIHHKTEKGLVRINVKNLADAREAFNSIRKAAGKDAPVIFYRMIEGSREFMAGIMRHPGFPPAVMFGLGGTYTEVLRDITFRIAPLTDADAQEMLDDFNASKLLKEFRGMQAADRAALAKLLIQLAYVPLIHPEVVEIDINPVIISGTHPVAVDALVVLE